MKNNLKQLWPLPILLLLTFAVVVWAMKHREYPVNGVMPNSNYVHSEIRTLPTAD